jgi:hypothetical protein
MLPNPFQFNVHIRLAILSYATSDTACFSFISFIKFIANGERVGWCWKYVRYLRPGMSLMAGMRSKLGTKPQRN